MYSVAESPAAFCSRRKTVRNHGRGPPEQKLPDEKPKKASAAQQTLFDADAATDTDGEGKFIKEYVCHYRQLGAESDNEQLELTI